MTELAQHYDYILYIHRHSTIGAKVAIATALFLVATGNRQPGLRLLPAVLAAQLLVAGFLGVFAGLWPAMMGLLALTLAGVCGWIALRPPIDWQVAPPWPSPWRTPIAVAYALAICYPFLAPKLSASMVLYGPAAITPHGAVLATMLLARQTPGEVPRLLLWSSLAVAVALGGLDLGAGKMTSGIVLLLSAAAVGISMRGGVARLRTLEREAPPQEAPKRQTAVRPAEGRKTGRNWDL